MEIITLTNSSMLTSESWVEVFTDKAKAEARFNQVVLELIKQAGFNSFEEMEKEVGDEGGQVELEPFYFWINGQWLNNGTHSDQCLRLNFHILKDAQKSKPQDKYICDECNKPTMVFNSDKAIWTCSECGNQHLDIGIVKRVEE